jgi:mycofactocin precursor
VDTIIIDEPVGTIDDRDEFEAADEELLDGELLVEEISIDGMCGVY